MTSSPSSPRNGSSARMGAGAGGGSAPHGGLWGCGIGNRIVTVAAGMKKAAGRMPAPQVARASCPELSVTIPCAGLTIIGIPALHSQRVINDNHRFKRAPSCRLSSATSSSVSPGHTPWADRKSSVSHRESCPSNSRTRLVENRPSRYPSTAKASNKARGKSGTSMPRLAAASSGMSKVTVMAEKDTAICPPYQPGFCGGRQRHCKGGTGGPPVLSMAGHWQRLREHGRAARAPLAA